jgi:heme-degrading monooxygenase HmoA
MIAVIFEVWPSNGRKADYLQHAERLRGELAQMEGFISVERFQSLTDPDKLLSLSFWRDEAAVARWRCHTEHRATQSAGRRGIFSDYRLRVAGGSSAIMAWHKGESRCPKTAGSSMMW